MPCWRVVERMTSDGQPPMEFAVEDQKVLGVSLEGSVG
jgi:hypothetical protein